MKQKEEETFVIDDEQKKLILDYITRLKNIENEISVLSEDKKELEEEFKKKIDLKTLKQAVKVHKVLVEVKNKTTYDEMFELLEKEGVQSV